MSGDINEIAQRIGGHIRERAVIQKEWRLVHEEYKRLPSSPEKEALDKQLLDMVIHMEMLSATIQAEHYEFEAAKTNGITERVQLLLVKVGDALK